MIYDTGLAWRNIRSRSVQTLVTLLVVALATALPITVLALGDGTREGIAQASDPFGVLVVGAKGSSQQLVLNTILLQDVPVGNISHDVYETLKADPRVSLAIPIAMGDNIGGAPIIGTEATFFELRAAQNELPAFQISEGRIFSTRFEAVLGSKAAKSLGLKIGDAFRGQHGVHEGLPSDVHEDVYIVVGILAPSNTPYDTAVYVTLETVWDVHAEEADAEHFAASTGSIPPDLADPATSTTDQVTAVLVKPVGFIEANQLWQDYYVSTDAQAVFPGKELGDLFDLLRQGEQVLIIVGYLVLLIACLTIFLSIYSATLSREQSIAVMRGLGGSRMTVFRVVIFETVLITFFGAALGRVLGYGLAYSIASVVEREAAIPIPIRYLPDLEPLLWAAPFGLGIAAGFLPAVMAYRVNVVEKLFPT
jgi:putative ABC transport system permease protein